MMLLPTQHVVQKRVSVKGKFFGARGSSCSCDPCDCNPCRCGDVVIPQPPSWRVSGVVIDAGNFDGTDLSHLVLLSLSLPRQEGEWEELFLVDQHASPEQIACLLAIFEEELESLPAEVEPFLRFRRAVYSTPIEYLPDEERPFLRVNTVRDRMTLVRASEQSEHVWPGVWVYDGPMALRGGFERHS